jgi:hypothetical protein
MLLGLTLSVAGANAAGPCQFPTVAAFRAGETKCSGTLIHPELVVTAAHCLLEGRPDNVRFGESFSPSAMRVDVAQCHVNPGFSDGQAPSEDYAVCRLVEAVQGIPATPLLASCEVDALVPEASAVVVGFGITDTDDGFGIKRYGFTRIAGDPRSDGTIWIGDEEVGGCLGDSGGPTFVQLADGGWRTVGVLTFAPPCGQGEGLFRTLADRTAWIEEVTGLDVTPCHDDAGMWLGGADCVGVSGDPRAPDTDWAGLCSGPTITPTTLCEPQTGTDTDSDSGSDSGTGSDSDSDTGTGTAATAQDSDFGCAVGRAGPVGFIFSIVLLAVAGRT